MHVVFATNGDDNPWPHRLLGRKWKIDLAARRLWGMRRAEEALAALETLGCPRNCATFLNLPDQRLTEIFLRRDGEVMRRIASLIEDARPTLIVAPSPFDLHADHSALHLFTRFAATLAKSEAGLLYYSVHTRGYHSDWPLVAIELTGEEQAVKRRAILRHRSQMALSRSRFLRHARSTERFFEASSPREIDLHHSIRGGRMEADALVLQLQRRKGSGSFARCTLLVATERENAGERWAVRLPQKSGNAVVKDAASGAAVGRAKVLIQGMHAQVRLPVCAAATVTQLFAKLKQPSLFFDASGWRELPAALLPAYTPPIALTARARRLKRPRRPRLKARAAR